MTDRSDSQFGVLDVAKQFHMLDEANPYLPVAAYLHLIAAHWSGVGSLRTRVVDKNEALY